MCIFSLHAKAAQASLAAALLAAGEPAMEVIALVNALNDDITAAVLRQALASMAEAGWGEPPVSFAALVMGSAGRGESLLHPDQDNGFILADHADFEHESLDRFFVELAQRFTRGLEQAGFPLCEGDVMATNPLWRKPLAQWHMQVTGWVRARGNQEIMFTDIFFDFRAISGPPELAAAFAAHFRGKAAKKTERRTDLSLDDRHGYPGHVYGFSLDASYDVNKQWQVAGGAAYDKYERDFFPATSGEHGAQRYWLGAKHQLAKNMKAQVRIEDLRNTTYSNAVQGRVVFDYDF